MMKFSDVIQDQTEYIDILEKDLMLEVIRKGVSNIELKKKLQGAVMKLDRGANDENMNELCNLAFLPGVEIGISLRFDKKYFGRSHFRFVIFSLV